MYLVTQIKFSSKKFQLTPSIFWFYCIERCTRILEQLDLLIYEFSTNFYWISKFTAKITKKPLLLLFIWVTSYSNNPPGFRFFSTWGPWPVVREGAQRWPAKSRRGGHRRWGESGVGASPGQGAPLGGLVVRGGARRRRLDGAGWRRRRFHGG